MELYVFQDRADQGLGEVGTNPIFLKISKNQNKLEKKNWPAEDISGGMDWFAASFPNSLTDLPLFCFRTHVHAW